MNHYGVRAAPALMHEPQDERIQPQADERDEPGTRLRRAGQKQPPAGVGRPRGRAPPARRVGLGGQELQRIGHHVEGREDAAPLGRGLAIDHGGVGRPAEAPVDLRLVTEPRGELLGRGLQG